MAKIRRDWFLTRPNSTKLALKVRRPMTVQAIRSMTTACDTSGTRHDAFCWTWQMQEQSSRVHKIKSNLAIKAYPTLRGIIGSGLAYNSSWWKVLTDAQEIQVVQGTNGYLRFCLTRLTLRRECLSHCCFFSTWFDMQNR